MHSEKGENQKEKSHFTTCPELIKHFFMLKSADQEFLNADLKNIFSWLKPTCCICHSNYFMINLHKSMGPDQDQTLVPWICSQTRFCSQKL